MQNFDRFIANLTPKFQAVLQKRGKIHIISTMSGTSTDAVDVAFFEISTNGIILKSGYTLHYTVEDKALIKNAEIGFQKAYEEYPTTSREILMQHARKYYDVDRAAKLSEQYHIRAIQALLQKIPAEIHSSLSISYHGQTSLHKPALITVQIGDPQILANALGFPVIGDLRVRDVENGGQGAPFAPMYHFLLYKLGLLGVPPDQTCVTVNCGGIANIAVLKPDSFYGFDTGPGAGLIQLYLSKFHNEQQDTDGLYAKQGKKNLSVLNALFEKSVIQKGINYFDMLPPKSLDFHDLKLIPELEYLSKEDACATLAAFTAESILRETGNPLPRTWILVGGGWNNQSIVAELKNRLQARKVTNFQILREKDLGLEYVECGIFALAAAFKILDWPFTFPETSGVNMPVIAGSFYYPE